jgi:GST-like protein
VWYGRHTGSPVVAKREEGAMIDLYTWKTDNGFKGRQALEESGLDYTLKPVNLQERKQYEPEFLKISPGHKIPAIIDHDGPGGATVSLCESGAILKYVGEKAANGIYPTDPVKRAAVDQWLFYGSATFTTLAQQFGFFVVRTKGENAAAAEHYTNVLQDMFGMLDRRLGQNEYICGSDYTVADISMYPDTHIHGINAIGLGDYPNVQRWHDAIAARPAVQRAWEPY